MSEEDMHKASMAMHALQEAIADLEAVARYPDNAAYLAQHWSHLWDAHHRLTAAFFHIFRATRKAA
jgi:hypothetical protein